MRQGEIDLMDRVGRILRARAGSNTALAILFVVLAACVPESRAEQSDPYVEVWQRSIPSPRMCVDVDDSGNVLVGMWSSGVQLIDRDGDVEWAHPMKAGTFCTGATMSPDGRCIGFTDTTSQLHLLNRAGEVIRVTRLDGMEYVSRPRMSGDGALITVTGDGSPYLVAGTGDVLLRPSDLDCLVAGRRACEAAISADGLYVIAACSSDPANSGFPTDFSMHFLDCEGNLLWTHELEWMPQTAIGVSASADIIAVPVGDKIYVLDKAGESLSVIQTGDLSEAVVSASGDLIVSSYCEESCIVRVTDPYGRIIWQSEQAWESATGFPGLGMSPNGRYIAAAEGERVVLFERQP